MPAAGGTLYFPAGAWPLATTITLAKPITVRGDGNTALYDDSSGAATVITFNSATASAFNVTSKGCSFHDFMLVNVASSTPSAGAGITVSANGDLMHYERITVRRFYDDIDILDGAEWSMNACYLIEPIHYAARIVHSDFSGDFGDWSISDCVFTSGPRDATSALRIESGGGGKIVNSKFNGWLGPYGFNYDIDLAVATGVATVDLLVSNCSIENYKIDGVRVTNASGAKWRELIFNGNDFGAYVFQSTHAISIVATALHDLDDVIISNNSFIGALSPTGSAIYLENIDTGQVRGNNLSNAANSYTTLLDQVNCVNITTDTTGVITLSSEVLMADGITPPDPLTTDDETDWLYGA